MEKFTTLTAIAVPLEGANIDTNQLCPSRFSKTPRGPEYARILLHDARFNPDGSTKGHVLDREPYRGARILVADRNFGCGSSREGAVYGLCEFGIRCVIAPSFGEIFLNNCYKNGLLPVVLPAEACAQIRRQIAERPGAELAVDLPAQVVTDALGRAHRFEINPVRKRCLLEGLDDIARTESYGAEIAAFETRDRAARPWLWFYL
ncbi:MAG TPA: 3-isopropylmalate dehydratase small subunit [Burkholderiales bacterium]|nr:3-isopropylmalate dehydratase small subunit [Burkholderiales bacterium]